MSEMSDIVRVAIDAYHGNVQKYSVDQSMDVLRKALIDANNGSTKLDYRAIRDGKCNGLFTIVEEILSRVVVEGLQQSDFFNTLVDFRNLALGDQNEFKVENSNLFYVSEVAPGTQGIRRQRVEGYDTVKISTTPKAIKIYEELDRVLSGRVDFNHFINIVGQSMAQRLMSDIYDLWINATAADLGGAAYFPVATNQYDEDLLLTTIAHVEAAAGGRQATLLGTAPTLRVLAPAVQGADSKSDLYSLGYYGKFYSNPVMKIPQRHKVNSTAFQFDDKVITIVAGDDKPIKCVYEGNPLIIPTEALTNADLTMEYMLMERWGLGLVLAGGNAGLGRYQFI